MPTHLQIAARRSALTTRQDAQFVRHILLPLDRTLTYVSQPL